jgi:hypothetical protein
MQEPASLMHQILPYAMHEVKQAWLLWKQPIDMDDDDDGWEELDATIRLHGR